MEVESQDTANITHNMQSEEDAPRRPKTPKFCAKTHTFFTICGHIDTLTDCERYAETVPGIPPGEELTNLRSEACDDKCQHLVHHKVNGQACFDCQPDVTPERAFGVVRSDPHYLNIPDQVIQHRWTYFRQMERFGDEKFQQAAIWEWMEPQRIESRKQTWAHMVSEIRQREAESNTPLFRRAVFIGHEDEGNILRPFKRGQQVYEGPCPVCRTSIEVEGVMLPCNHSFHRNCLIPWITSTHHCPVCKDLYNVSHAPGFDDKSWADAGMETEDEFIERTETTLIPFFFVEARHYSVLGGFREL